MESCEEKKIIEKYYEALNSKNVDNCLEFLTNDLFVTFKEKERNWSGIETAKTKFSNMYNQNPKFYGEIIDFLEFKVTNQGSILIILAYFGNPDESFNEKKQKSKK